LENKINLQKSRFKNKEETYRTSIETKKLEGASIAAQAAKQKYKKK